MTRAKLWVLLALVVALTSSVLLPPRAVGAPEAVTWEQTPGPTGGKVNVLLIDGRNPSILYAGTDGGVFTSRDGGATWQNLSTGLPGASQVNALIIDPLASHILYAGTNSGVYRSSNGGHSWSRAGVTLTGRLVLSLAMDPSNSSVLYAGTDREVFKSTDGGTEWSLSSAGLLETSIWSLVVDYVDPGTLYAGTDDGVFQSANGGQRWQRKSEGMPDKLRVQVLVMDPHIPGILCAATEKGVYRTSDPAGTWQAFLEGIGENIVHDLVTDPSNASTLYAAVGTDGVSRSINGGKSWESTGGMHELVLTLAINPARPQVIYAGTGRGVYSSSNAGQSWEPRNEGLVNANVLLFAMLPQHPEKLYASTGLDVHRTTDYGQSWVPINKGFVHPNVHALAVDPLSADTVYAGTWDSEVYKSVDGGSTWRLMSGALAREASVLALLVYREQLGQATRESDAGAVFAGTNGAGVFVSPDGGVTWQPLNEGLDDLRVQVLALAVAQGGTPRSCRTETGQATSLGEQGSILFAGTASGLYRLGLAGVPQGSKTEEQGGSSVWQPVQDSLPRAEVKSILVDENSPHVVYVVLATGSGELYRSTDAGVHWEAIGGGSLPTTINIQALAINPSRRRPSILYAGTDSGVFRSADGGITWRGISNGLPARAHVSALLFDAKGSTLYASITNGGVYKALDKEQGPLSWPLLATVLSVVAALGIAIFVVWNWLLRSGGRAQEQVFERNWPLWREEIQRLLVSENEVRPNSLAPWGVPARLRMRALQQYTEEHGEENLSLRLNPPVLEPANSLQVWDFLRNWRAAQKRLTSPAAFRPVALRITEQLCQVLGFALLDSRSYKKLHGFVIKAPTLHLKMPPTFPIIFLHKPEVMDQDFSEVRDLMGILNVTSYLAVLIVPDNGEAAGRGQELRARFKRMTGGAADDFLLLDFYDLYRILIAKDPERGFVSVLLSQVDLTVVSPYVTSGPVPENMFFGRDHELKTITRTIQYSNYAIVGGRKIGKTSILTKLNRLFRDSPDYYPLYLDCQAVQSYEDFCDTIETVWKLTLHDCSPESFMRLIARVKQEREGQLVVILLDEVDALLKYDAANQERLFKVFRALAQEGHCRFIFCGERVLYARLHDSASAFFNFCNIIRLSYLSPRDTGRVILEPLQEMGLDLEDSSKLVRGIVDLSACHPNIVQYICQELIALINQRGDRVITLADLDSIAASNRFNEYLIEVMWGNSTALERLITLLILAKSGVTLAQINEALREHGVKVSSAVLEQALDGLVLGSVLDKEEQEFRFAAAPFPAAISASLDVPSLIERLAQQVREACMCQ